MPRLRLGYRKSRSGCQRCRQRKVKCDENRPCGACVRHCVVCSLMSGDPTADPKVPTADDNSHITRKRNKARPAHAEVDKTVAPKDQALRSSFDSGLSGCSPPNTSSFSYFDNFVSTQISQDTGGWIADLELFHHFITHTCMTLPKAAEVSRLWEVDVPRLAFSNSHLMHILLALSGFHLAQLHPEQQQRMKYWLQGSLHQNKGIECMREKLAEITWESCHALFATSGLLFFTVFASLSSSDLNTHSPTVQGLVDVFLLVKGMSGILNAFESGLRSGPLGLTFGSGAPVSPSHDSLIMLMVEHINGYSDSLTSFGIDLETRSVIDAEIDALNRWVNLAANSTTYPEMRTVMTWPISMRSNYISMLRQRHPAALALMCHYCVILHATANDYWFLRGWGSGVAVDIESMLDSKWRDAIKWPMNWIRDHPSRNEDLVREASQSSEAV